MKIEIPVSAGELIDKISILRLKQERLSDPPKRTEVGKELALLEEIAGGTFGQGPQAGQWMAELLDVNGRIWEAEEALRGFERDGLFGDPFVQHARSVYLLNDQRAVLKAEINRNYGSHLQDQKSYI